MSRRSPSAIRKQQASDYNRRGVSETARGRGGWDEWEADLPPVTIDQPEPQEWPPDWWRDEYAEETFEVLQQVVAITARNYGHLIKRQGVFFDDLAGALTDASFDFAGRFTPNEEDMPHHWYAALHSYLRRHAEFKVQNATTLRDNRGAAYRSMSTEYENDEGDTFYVGDRYQHINSIELMPPEKLYVFIESILEGDDPRIGAPKPTGLCSSFGCQGVAVTLGMCSNHRRDHVEAWGTERGSNATCSVEGCVNFATSRGMCFTHYKADRQRAIDEGEWTPRPTLAGTPCTVDECGEPVRAGGMCSKHFSQQSALSKPVCIVDGCDKRVNARGLCVTHYRRWRQTGSTDIVRRPAVKDQPCSTAGCESLVGPKGSKGMCSKHYDAQRRKKGQASE